MFGYIAVFDQFTHGGAIHSGSHRCPAKAHGGDIAFAKSQRLEHIAFVGKAASDGNGGQIVVLTLQLLQDSGHFGFHNDGGQAPLVHHGTGAVTAAAAGAVKGDHIHLVFGGDTQHPLHIGRIVAGHLEVDVFQSQRPQLGNAQAEELLVPQGQTAVHIEVWAGSVGISLLNGRIGGVGMDNKAHLLFFPRGFQIRQPVDRLSALG